MGNGYLSLTREDGQYIAVYRTDENGNPIINDDVLVIKVLRISGLKVKLGFNGDSYKIDRTEILNGSIKEFVENKIKRLEERLKER